MSKKLLVVGLFVGFGMILTFQNCGNKNNPSGSDTPITQPGVNQAVKLNGTVQQLDLDGCGKVVVSNADGKSMFIPRGVDTSRFQPGDQVILEGTVATDIVSICMAGVIVNVTSLKPTNAQ